MPDPLHGGVENVGIDAPAVIFPVWEDTMTRIKRADSEDSWE